MLDVVLLVGLVPTVALVSFLIGRYTGRRGADYRRLPY